MVIEEVDYKQVMELSSAEEEAPSPSTTAKVKLPFRVLEVVRLVVKLMLLIADVLQVIILVLIATKKKSSPIS